MFLCQRGEPVAQPALDRAGLVGDISSRTWTAHSWASASSSPARASRTTRTSVKPSSDREAATSSAIVALGENHQVVAHPPSMRISSDVAASRRPWPAAGGRRTGDLTGWCHEEIAFPQVGEEPEGVPVGLTRFAWLSIAAALVTIALKASAYRLTGSVGLLSDAAESVVNLVAAVVALIALRVAARPADDNHHYGHGKAEYFSAGIEGLMIFVAAAVILVSAVDRFLHPVGHRERRASAWPSRPSPRSSTARSGCCCSAPGRAHRSVTLTADGKHLLTDVWTSVGVIVGVLLVALTGWQRLDPVVAALVGVNILITGYRLVSQSVTSLLDAALPEEDVVRLTAVLDRLRTADVDFSDLRTRESGRHRFVALTVLVPGSWTVEQAHDVADEVESAIAADLAHTEVQTHIEPHARHAAGATGRGDRAVAVPLRMAPGVSGRRRTRNATAGCAGR